MSGSPGAVFIGASGGCGTTTLATGVALAVVRTGASCLLLELDLARGDIAGAFGVPSDRTIEDLEVVADELSATHVSAAAYPHRSGIEVVFAPTRPARAGWGRDAAAGLVAAAAGCGRVVVDASGGLSEAVVGAVDAGAIPVVVAPPTRSGARRAAALAACLPTGGTGVLVLSRTPGPRELGKRAAERLVRLPVLCELPESGAEAASLGMGRWPAKRRSRLAHAIEDVARQVLS